MVSIHITLPFGAKDSSKIKSVLSVKDALRASEGKRTWYSKTQKEERGVYIPEGWHWRGVAFPACVPNVSTSSRPPYLQLWRC